MNIAKQHLEFKNRFNKLNSNHYPDLNTSQIDSLIDAAAIFLLRLRGKEYEETQFLKDLFSTLTVKYPEQAELASYDTQDTGIIQHEFKLSELKYPYRGHVRSYVRCGGQVVPVSIIKHDEQQKINDSYQKPSFKWKRLSGMMGKSSDEEGQSLYVNSDVELDALRIEYIKQPKKVFFGYYDTIEYLDCTRRLHENFPGVESCNQYYSATDIPVNSDLPEQFHDLQVDVAVYLATGKTENAQLLSISQLKLI